MFTLRRAVLKRNGRPENQPRTFVKRKNKCFAVSVGVSRFRRARNDPVCWRMGSKKKGAKKMNFVRAQKVKGFCYWVGSSLNTWVDPLLKAKKKEKEKKTRQDKTRRGRRKRKRKRKRRKRRRRKRGRKRRRRNQSPYSRVGGLWQKLFRSLGRGSDAKNFSGFTVNHQIVKCSWPTDWRTDWLTLGCRIGCKKEEVEEDKRRSKEKGAISYGV